MVNFSNCQLFEITFTCECEKAFKPKQFTIQYINIQVQATNEPNRTLKRLILATRRYFKFIHNFSVVVFVPTTFDICILELIDDANISSRQWRFSMADKHCRFSWMISNYCWFTIIIRRMISRVVFNGILLTIDAKEIRYSNGIPVFVILWLFHVSKFNTIIVWNGTIRTFSPLSLADCYL